MLIPVDVLLTRDDNGIETRLVKDVYVDNKLVAQAIRNEALRLCEFDDAGCDYYIDLDKSLIWVNEQLHKEIKLVAWRLFVAAKHIDNNTDLERSFALAHDEED